MNNKQLLDRRRLLPPPPALCPSPPGLYALSLWRKSRGGREGGMEPRGILMCCDGDALL